MIIRKRRSVSFISSSDEADDDGVYPIVPLSVWNGYRAMQIDQRTIRVLRPEEKQGIDWNWWTSIDDQFGIRLMDCLRNDLFMINDRKEQLH